MSKKSGPLGTDQNQPEIDAGTLVRTASPKPGVLGAGKACGTKPKARIIRVSGSPMRLVVYGSFNPAVEKALDDGWLSRAELYELGKQNLNKQQDVPQNNDFLFRILTGKPSKSTGKTPAEQMTYQSISGYVDLPRNGMWVNRYDHWRNRPLNWLSIFTKAGFDKARSIFLDNIKQIQAEPDIAPDDKANLLNLQYLELRYYLRHLERERGQVGIVITLNLYGSSRTFRALTDAEVDQYDKLLKQENYIGLFQMAGKIVD